MSQRLYTNKGVPRAAIDQKAEYSVGDAYLPEYLGADIKTGDAVESWLVNTWFPNCDTRGGVYDWNQLLILASISIDREGECFVLLTETEEEKFPLLQLIPSHKIRSSWDEKTVESGQFEGATLHDGIIKNKRGRAIGYRVYEDKDTFEDIPARSIIHLFNPRYQDQGRGLPAFTHAIEDLKHCLQSTDDERRRQAILSSLGLIVHNELGGPDMSDPRFALGQANRDNEAHVYESTGDVHYFTAGQGEKLEQMRHDTPGEVWESFHDRLIREAISGVGWSYSLVWKPTGQGTAERGEILRARRAVKARQKLLDHLAKRAITYAVAYATERNELPKLRAPLSWKLSKPPRLTVDDGRESKAMAEEYRLGSRNLGELLEAEGKTYEDHLSKRIDEIVKRKQAIAEAEATHGVQIDEREVVMLTPNETANQNQDNDNSTDD